jgi:hypothetical protein
MRNLICTNAYSGTIVKDTTVYSDILKTQRREGMDGFFSIQPVFTGTGVLSISYQVSNDGTVWSPAVAIIATAVSGTVYPYPDGVNIFSAFQRLVLTETGTANPVVVTRITRCYQ